MSGIFDFQQARDGARPARRGAGSIGFDLLVVALLGITVALGGAWLHANPSAAAALVKHAAPKTETLLMPAKRYPLCSRAIRRNCVVDGDTFYLAQDKIRIADIDAPETHPPRCAREADLGDRATVRLSQLLSAGTFQLAVADRDRDRYGRKLRIVTRNGRSIGDQLVSEGLARTWAGRRQPWCGSDADSFG